jgi:hypothetical protein
VRPAPLGGGRLFVWVPMRQAMRQRTPVFLPVSLFLRLFFSLVFSFAISMTFPVFGAPHAL